MRLNRAPQKISRVWSTSTVFLRRLLETTDAFFFGTYDGRPLAIFRIAMGLLMLTHSLTSKSFWEMAYGSTGMMADQSGNFYEFHWFSILDQTQDWISIDTWWWILIALVVFWTVGLGGRLCSLLLLILTTSIYYRNLTYSNAEQSVFRFALTYSCLLPISDHLSLDSWIRKKFKQPHPPRPRLWILRSFQFHLCLIYLISTSWKLLSDDAWRTGDAMYYVAVNPTWGRVPFPSLFYNEWFSKILTWGSLFAEWSFSFLVFIPKLRKWIALELMTFHILIAIFLANVTYFSLGTAICLLVFFEWKDLEGCCKNIHPPKGKDAT